MTRFCALRERPPSKTSCLRACRHACEFALPPLPLPAEQDTIIFALIERAQFAQNPCCYNGGQPAYSNMNPTADSLLDFMLLETERLHARIRRYTSPDEHAYFPHLLPAPQLPLIEFPPVLHPNLVNLNQDIMDLYLSKVLPGLCPAGDDGQHGSSVVADVSVLQAISKRVHYGFFVAESKFQAQTAQFTALIEAGDDDGIMALLTHAAVEERVLRRVGAKAATFGMEIEAPPPEAASATSAAPAVAATGPQRVDPELIVRLYREHVIPLTKVAELRYLQMRLRPAVLAHHGGDNSACARAAREHIGTAYPAGRAPPPTRRCATADDVFQMVLSNKAHAGVVRGAPCLEPSCLTAPPPCVPSPPSPRVPSPPPPRVP